MRPLIRLVALALIAVLALAACSGSPEYSPLTMDEIADNQALFFSVQHDRSDIKKGEFELYPWKDDRFSIISDVPIVIDEKETTTKEFSDDGRKITVNTETVYWLSLEETLLVPAVARDVMVEFEGREVAVPVSIQIELFFSLLGYGTIDEQTAQELKDLGDGSHLWKVRVSLAHSPFMFKSSRTRFSPSPFFSPRAPALDDLKDALLGARRVIEGKLLSENAEYQELKKNLGDFTFDSDESRRYHEILGSTRFQAKKQAEETWSSDPSEYLENPDIFPKQNIYIVVTVEEIDGVKIRYVD